MIANGVVDRVPDEPWGQYFEVLEECSKVPGERRCTCSCFVAPDGLLVVLLHSSFEMLMGASDVYVSCEFTFCLIYYYTAPADVIVWAFVIGRCVF